MQILTLIKVNSNVNLYILFNNYFAIKLRLTLRIAKESLFRLNINKIDQEVKLSIIFKKIIIWKINELRILFRTNAKVKDSILKLKTITINCNYTIDKKINYKKINKDLFKNLIKNNNKFEDIKISKIKYNLKVYRKLQFFFFFTNLT